MLRSLVILATGMLIGASIVLSFTTERGAETRKRVVERVRERRHNGYAPEEERLFDELKAETTV